MTPRQILSHAIEEAVTFGDIPAPLEPAVMTASTVAALCWLLIALAAAGGVL
jgi:hypothetical protein